MHDSTDETTIDLLFANKKEIDILLRKELEEAAMDPRIRVSFTIEDTEVN